MNFNLLCRLWHLLDFDEYIQTYFKHVVLKYSYNKVKEFHISKHYSKQYFKFQYTKPYLMAIFHFCCKVILWSTLPCFRLGGKLFKLTTRFCNLGCLGNPSMEVTYDRHYNTIQKTYVIFIIWDFINKSNCYMNFLEVTLFKCCLSTTNPSSSNI